MQRYQKFSKKRKFASAGTLSAQEREELARSVTYTGNPEHKRSPGDFGLIPPAQPRRGKSLCDTAKIFQRRDALRYLQQGLQKGAFSAQFIDRWPKTVWSVTDDGIPLEAQRDGDGSYHGYPLQEEDPMAAEVLNFWNTP